eukprot:GHVS01060777.1.p1 GENE.GHVS01060777.1~~GHVS01060777.1.p1  ORF type:complete len:648 (+),score=30.84 GHVS01060777.1:250-2193(+)
MEPNKPENVEFTTEPLPVIEFSDLTCRLPSPPLSGFSSLFPRKPSRSFLTVLNGISGSIAAGETVAIIGPSGSGKSSFLDAMTGTFGGSCTGTIKSNGRIMTNKDLRRMTSYMRQTAPFLPELSVYETIRYEALLKLPQHMTYSQKMERVEQVIEATGLNSCRCSRMSLGLGRCLSGGEVKRVMMANALLTSPRLFLLDEPTTGLDSSRAAAIVDLICELGEHRHLAVFCVAHQLSTQLLMKFHRLMIFCSGSLIYQGPTADAVGYFQSLGFEQLPNSSLGEHLSSLAAMQEGADKLVRCYKSNIRRLDSARYSCYFPSERAENSHMQTNCDNQEKVVASLPEDANEEPVEFEPKLRAASVWSAKLAEYERRQTTTTRQRVQGFLRSIVRVIWWHQMYWLFRRRLQQAARRSITCRRIAVVSIQSILAAMVFFQLFPGLTDNSFLHVRGFICYTQAFLSLALMHSLVSSYGDVGFYRFERSAKSYPISALLVACNAADLAIDQLIPSCYLLLIYFSAGLPPIAAVFWVFLMIVVSHMWTFGGICLPVGGLPAWLLWATWFSFVPYACDALYSIMLAGQSFACEDESVQPVCPVSGEEFATTMSIHGLSTVQNMCALLGMGAALFLSTYALIRCSSFKMRHCLGGGHR